MQQPGPYYETRYEIAAVIAKRILSMEPLLLCSLLLCYWPADCPLQETVQESPELLLKGFTQHRHPYKLFRAPGVLTLFLQNTALLDDTHKYVFTFKTKFPTTVTFCVGTVYAYNGDFSVDFVESAAGIYSTSVHRTNNNNILQASTLRNAIWITHFSFQIIVQCSPDCYKTLCFWFFNCHYRSRVLLQWM